MLREVAIVGIGCTGFKSITPGLSYKEIMFEAATRAYEDAGVDPRRDIDNFITCAEDYWEGFSIFDEFIPDQLGAVLRPAFTLCADGLFGLATAYMLIRTGQFDTVAVEAHSKASDILTFADIVAFALDPIFNRPLGGHPFYIAGLEMARYLHETENTKEQCAEVVVKNKENALSNPLAAHGTKIRVEDVINAERMFDPLGRLDISPLADGCVVMVVASEKVAKKLTDTPVWVEGVGWNSDTPWLETREWGKAPQIKLAAKMAYRMADITSTDDIDLAEVDDKFSFKELQAIEALNLFERGKAGQMTENGDTRIGGYLPINPSGGSLGVGHLLEAVGLQKALEVVLQLRGEAGKRQIPGAEIGLVQVTRLLPSRSSAVAILSN